MYALTLKDLLNHTKIISLPETDVKLQLERVEGDIVHFRGGKYGFSADQYQKVLVRDGTTIVPVFGLDGEVLYPRFTLFGDLKEKSEILSEYEIRNKHFSLWRDIIELFQTHAKITTTATSSVVSSINIIKRSTTGIVLAFLLVNRATETVKTVQFNLSKPTVDFYPLTGTVTLVADSGTTYTFKFEDFIVEKEKSEVQKIIQITGDGFDGKPIGDFHPTPFQEMMYEDLVRKFTGPETIFNMYGSGNATTSDMVQLQMSNYKSITVLKLDGVSKDLKVAYFTDRSMAIWFYIKSLFEMAG